MPLLYFLLFIVSCFALSYAGNQIVDSLVHISRFLKWKAFVVSSILMGLSTSLPEVFLGVTSAFNNHPEIILGVVIGSNLIAATIIIGVTAISTGTIELKGKIIQRSIFRAMLYNLIPFFLLRDGSISRLESFILLGSFVFYYFHLISQERRFEKVFNGKKRDWVGFKLLFKSLLIFIGSFIILLLSSQGIVSSTVKIAEHFNLSKILISLFLISIGTSLPEIIFGIKSTKLEQKDMIIGNIMGSIVTNSTLVLGLTALISPIIVNDLSPYYNGITFIIITCLFFLIFAKTDHEITKKESFLLIAIYLIFILIEADFLNWPELIFSFTIK